MSRWICSILLALCPLSFAQVTGRITGAVQDPAGGSIAKAKISVFLAGGATPVAEAESTAEGLYSVEAMRPETYDVLIEAQGFQPQRLRNVKVDPARATDLPIVKLEISVASTSIEVTAGAETVQTTATDIATTVTMDQIRRLPVEDRDPLAFISTQAGVSATMFGTAINGQRVSFSALTLDGVNVQDPWIKDNGLTFTPNQLLLDQVQEFTVITSNSGAKYANASVVSFSTPSGSNALHGRLYWQNRNNKLAANDWFDNTDGIPLQKLNLNNIGGAISGPIKHDKLFYFVNYEASRFRGRDTANSTILTQDARNGIFSYRNTSGQIVKANVLNIVGVRPDPLMAANLALVPGPEKINNYRVGDSQLGQLLNTAGYTFQVRSNRDRDNISSRLDYSLSTKHTLEASFKWNHDLVDRPFDGVGYSPIPVFQNDNSTKGLALAWRWNPNATFTNEVRGGFNFLPADFIRTDPIPPFFIAGTTWSSPIVQGQPQGRLTRTYNLENNSVWVRGRHTVEFGYFLQTGRTSLYDFASTTPTYSVGIDSFAQEQFLLFPEDLRGIASSQDFDRANLLLASLAGLLDNAGVQFNATTRTSGFVPGAAFARRWSYDNHALYAEDKWKILPRVTLTAGLRWDYYTPVNVADSMALQPVFNGDARLTLLSNATLDFAGNSVGRPFYKKDLNNFAPNIGLAWDVFGNGKTSFRAGYSTKFVTDQQTTVTSAYSATNAGLSASVLETNLAGTMSNRRALEAPKFFIPRKFSDNYALDPTSFFTMLDPGLSTPYVQEWTASIQHEIKGTIIEARYIGNHGTKMLRGFDYNQIDYRSNGFLDDFLRAQSNGNLARRLTGVFDARYNPSIPGSRPLTVFPRMLSGGLITNPTIRTLIDRGEVAELGQLYQINGLNGAVNFYNNPDALVTVFGTNFANSRYDSLQLEVRRRFQRGMEYQANYTFSKWLSNTAGTDQLRYEPLLDINNASLEKSRNPYDLTHQFKANFAYDLPFVRALHPRRGWLTKTLEGWTTSGTVTWQSGNPFSIASQRGTFVPGFLSGVNEADTIYDKGVLTEIVGFRKTGAGPFIVPASARGADGRGVAPEGQSPFTGQIFFNPGAGSVGALQRRFFTGPSLFDMSAAVRKEMTFRDRYSAILTLEALNVFNHPTFAAFTQNINSTQFGRITSMGTVPRRLQMSLRLSF